MNVVVLAGGLSPERDVSLSSGCMIANALIESGHKTLLADLYTGLPGADDFSGAYDKYKRDKYEFRVPEREPDLDEIKKAGGDRQIGEGILSVCADADITFNALHGAIGENGQIQAVFDVYGVKYTGTGYIGSLLAMDKPIAKELARLHGITTPDWRVVETDGTGRADMLRGIDTPCVIKPCGCGSSIGVTIVHDPEELAAAYDYARKYENRILVERKITGREFSVGVLGGEALPPIEIIPHEGFYDYKNKYQPGAALEVCPPENLAPEAYEAMRATALKIHGILRLGDYARMDMILDAEGELYFLEANTLPGMTPTSLLPQEAAAVGVSYRQLCDRIIQLGLKRG